MNNIFAHRLFLFCSLKGKHLLVGVKTCFSLQVEKKMSNNVNKALVIDYSDSRLISCGSLFQGKNSNFVHFLCPLPPLPVKQQREFFQARAKKLGAN